MSSIDNIVSVSISVDTPTDTGNDIEGMLLVIEAATNTATVTMDTVQEIDYASDLVQYGYTTDSNAYKVAQLVFKQSPCPKHVYVTAWDSSSATITEALTTASAYTGWYGFVMADQSSGSNLTLAADWAEEHEKLFGFSYDDDDIPVDITDYSRTFALYYTGDEGDEDNEWGAAAWMSKCLGYDPGSETWSHKTLTGITASALTTSEIEDIYEIPANVYITIANKDITREGKVGTGEWIDVIRLVDYIKARIQQKVYAYLTANAKVKYDDEGITGVQNAVMAVLQEVQENGGILADSVDDDGNITKGYTVTVPLAADVSASDRASRILRDVKFQAYITGAIHCAVVTGVLSY